MRIKAFFLVIAVFFIGLAAYAQDKIIKKNGEVIEARVSVINQDNVVFKRYDNLEGPEYSIPKADVARIKYPNGTEDIFEDDNDKIGIKRHDMGKANGNSMHNEKGVLRNIISIIPIAVTDGVGAGASIEHVLDSKGVVNFYMPVMATFQRTSDYYTNSAITFTMVYFSPGIKMYTNLNTRKKMKFSIGPSVVLGMGNGDASRENSYSGTYSSGQVSRFVMGVMGNIGFNFFPTQHVFMGIDYGVGFCFANDYAGVNQGFTALEQLAIKIGYRF